MKNILLIILFLIIASTFSNAQTKNNDFIRTEIKRLKAEKVLVLNYDKSSNMSRLLAFGEEFAGKQARANGLSSLSFGIAFSYPGEEIKAAPQSFMLTFWAHTKKPKFAAARGMRITVDGEVLDFGEARYANKGEGIEYLNFNFTREQMMKIAAGKDAILKIGDAAFNFKPEHIKMFRDLLSISAV